VARSKTNIDPKLPIIGWIGAMFKKDAQLLADSFNQLVQEVPNAHLLIAGYHNHDFKSMVVKPENLIFTGYLSDEDLNTYMSVCDLYWLPIVDSNANRGRFPFKLTHFMTMERPTITSPVGDIPDLFSGEEIGILTPDRPEGYVRHTIELMQQPERRRRMGINARKLAGEKFDWDRLTGKLEDFYERTVKEFSSSGKE
jgi:glycosyltransferase involved in cell wall biosynthesis